MLSVKNWDLLFIMRTLQTHLIILGSVHIIANDSQHCPDSLITSVSGCEVRLGMFFIKMLYLGKDPVNITCNSWIVWSRPLCHAVQTDISQRLHVCLGSKFWFMYFFLYDHVSNIIIAYVDNVKKSVPITESYVFSLSFKSEPYFLWKV